MGYPHFVYCIRFWPSSLKSRYIRNGRYSKDECKIVQSWTRSITNIVILGRTSLRDGNNKGIQILLNYEQQWLCSHIFPSGRWNIIVLYTFLWNFWYWPLSHKSYQTDTAGILLWLEYIQKGLYSKQVYPYNKQQS